MSVLHWYYKQASSMKENDLGVLEKKRHPFKTALHFSNTLPFFHKLFSWDVPKISGVLYKAIFFKFIAK